MLALNTTYEILERNTDVRRKLL